MSSNFNDDYFILDATGKVIGNQWFYLKHHNCIENLWLLLASDNSGQGKGAQDAVEWLESKEIGREFLQGRKERIDRSGLIYLLDGVPLLKAFTSWVEEEKHGNIITYQQVAMLAETFRQRIAACESENQLRHVRNAIKVSEALAEQRGSSSESYDNETVEMLKNVVRSVASILKQEGMSYFNGAIDDIGANNTVHEPMNECSERSSDIDEVQAVSDATNTRSEDDGDDDDNNSIYSMRSK